MLTAAVVRLHSWLLVTPPPPTGRGRLRGDDGQTTAEYALVLVGAATLAFLLIAWATKTDRIGKLFDAVMDHVAGHIG
jgi:hypothetical protein